MHELYGRKGAGSMVVEAVLEECDVPYRLSEVKRDASRLPPADYYAVNPLGQVPALKLPDGTIMTESAAIVLYLADEHSNGKLAPAPGGPLRPQFLRWLVYLATNIYMTDLRIYYCDRYSTRAADGGNIKEAAVKAMAREWDVYAAALDSKPYMLGEQFSAVDVYAAMLATWNLDVPAFFRKHPNIHACYERIVARPAVARVWRRHDLEF
jgi:glutathione S-transferase/GST-like protein